MKRKKTLKINDIFSCPDSVLRHAVDNVYEQNPEGDKIENNRAGWQKDYPGELFLTPGHFSFFFYELSFGEFVDVPFEKLKECIKPEYRKRLIKK